MSDSNLAAPHKQTFSSNSRKCLVIIPEGTAEKHSESLRHSPLLAGCGPSPHWHWLLSLPTLYTLHLHKVYTPESVRYIWLYLAHCKYSLYLILWTFAHTWQIFLQIPAQNCTILSFKKTLYCIYCLYLYFMIFFNILLSFYNHPFLYFSTYYELTSQSPPSQNHKQGTDCSIGFLCPV